MHLKTNKNQKNVNRKKINEEAIKIQLKPNKICK